jgi:hypothetical protein
MSSASKSRRSRSRKRRPDPGSVARRPAVKASAPPPPTTTTRRGERPRPPWHPLPLAELLILVGALGTIVGLRRGTSHGGAPLIAGLVAVGLGTFEVTLREHSGGYRSHTILLALVPVVAFHSLVVLGVSAFTPAPVLLSVLLLPLDLALFVFCFKLLRARFLDARQARAVGRR